ncbi:MAG: hypothetical protein HFF02_07970 [Erysipelotrichaceae bacterium]|nr:hypothetical protein [Erysipelotrichaceae bacterium]
MIDWTATMTQTFEYYIIDPKTWKEVRKLNNITSVTIRHESDTETLGSATIDAINALGEAYVRIYMIVFQNGIKERIPLGTYLVQTPSSSFNGKVRTVSMDAYSPLLELKESPPPLGYSLLSGDNVMKKAYQICREHVRAPIVETESSETLHVNFVADASDTWLTFLTDLIANANYEFMLDEMGCILFSPKMDTASLQPKWTYTDDNSSILYPDIILDHDLYGIPNVVEVVYSKGRLHYTARIVNDDENSPTSTINRGREIIHRVDNPDLIGNPTKLQIQEYAEQLLRDLSSVEYSISYSHGYCPVRVGDCVRLNYHRAGITDIKAKVVSQSISCGSGCQVSEKAVFTTNLWGDV